MHKKSPLASVGYIEKKRKRTLSAPPTPAPRFGGVISGGVIEAARSPTYTEAPAPRDTLGEVRKRKGLSNNNVYVTYVHVLCHQGCTAESLRWDRRLSVYEGIST